MENIKLPDSKNALFIKRTINGQEFTVLIHFRLSDWVGGYFYHRSDRYTRKSTLLRLCGIK